MMSKTAKEKTSMKRISTGEMVEWFELGLSITYYDKDDMWAECKPLWPTTGKENHFDVISKDEKLSVDIRNIDWHVSLPMNIRERCATVKTEISYLVVFLKKKPYVDLLLFSATSPKGTNFRVYAVDVSSNTIKGLAVDSYVKYQEIELTSGKYEIGVPVKPTHGAKTNDRGSLINRSIEEFEEFMVNSHGVRIINHPLFNPDLHYAPTRNNPFSVIYRVSDEVDGVVTTITREIPIFATGDVRGIRQDTATGYYYVSFRNNREVTFMLKD